MKIKSVSLCCAIIISISFILSILAAVTSQINHHQQAIADLSNNTISAALNSSPVLGKPIFSEHDKATSIKQVDINGSKGLSVAFSGNGTVKGIDFTDIGTALVTFRPNGSGDVKGEATITPTGTNDGKSSDTGEHEKATYTFYSTARPDIKGTIVINNGAAFFHASSTTGRLASIDNLVVIFRAHIDEAGNGMIIGWRWK